MCITLLVIAYIFPRKSNKCYYYCIVFFFVFCSVFLLGRTTVAISINLPYQKDVYHCVPQRANVRVAKLQKRKTEEKLCVCVCILSLLWETSVCSVANLNRFGWCTQININVMLFVPSLVAHFYTSIFIRTIDSSNSSSSTLHFIELT